MQATSIKQFATRHIGVVAIAATIAVTGALAGQSAEASHPKLSISQVSTSITQTSEIAFAGAGLQGEGLVDAAMNAPRHSPLLAYLGLGQGEGFVETGAIFDFNVMLHSPAVAYLGLGQGEGFIGPGSIVDARVLQTSPLNAYLGSQQGEGLVDASNLPARKPLLAYTGVHQGEGLIGPGGGN
jgi:hypothetical protein